MRLQVSSIRWFEHATQAVVRAVWIAPFFSLVECLIPRLTGPEPAVADDAPFSGPWLVAMTRRPGEANPDGGSSPAKGGKDDERAANAAKSASENEDLA